MAIWKGVQVPIRTSYPGMLLRIWLLLPLTCLCLGDDFQQAAVGESQFCHKFVRSHGYTCREYKVLSADGFYLLLHRVTAISNSSSSSMRTDHIPGPGPAAVVNVYEHRADSVSDQSNQESDSGLVRTSAESSFSKDTPANFSLLQERACAPVPQAAGSSHPSLRVQESLSLPELDQWVGNAPSPSLSVSAPMNETPPSETNSTEPPVISGLDNFLLSNLELNQCVVPDHSRPSFFPAVNDPPSAQTNSTTPPAMSELDYSFLPSPLDLNEWAAHSPPYSYPAVNGTPNAQTNSTMPPAMAGIMDSFLVRTPERNSDCKVIHSTYHCTPVLLMHSEFLNGDSWFVPVEPEEVVLPFVLADDGFDVWIGHERATYWSHGQEHLNSNTLAYWNWTWDQHAQYDVPALLTFVNSKTRSKVHYIGVSQSAKVGVAAATVPEVSSLLQSLTLIGPPIYWSLYEGAITPVLISAWAGLFETVLDESAREGGQFNFMREFGSEYLSSGSAATWTFLSSIFGLHCCVNEKMVFVDNGWDATTSFKNLLHIQQGILKNTFQRFDHGSVRQNMEAYGGKDSPPAYEPDMIPSDIPILIVYGGQDCYAPPAGVMDFVEQLIRRPTLVFLPFYAHDDLLFSTRRFADVFTPIKSFIKSSGTEI